MTTPYKRQNARTKADAKNYFTSNCKKEDTRAEFEPAT
jgi:hypothetical protein